MNKIDLKTNNNWGYYYTFEKNESTMPNPINISIYASGIGGYMLINSILILKEELNLNIQITGAATDNLIDKNARISVKKRFWKYYSKDEKEFWFDQLKQLCLDNSINLYTGNVKHDDFRNILLKEWNPDISISAIFGQIFDSTILQASTLGIFNFHPSDLKNNIGIGSQPYDQPIKNGDVSIVMSLHEMTEEVDRGNIINESPPMNILNRHLEYPFSKKIIHNRIWSHCIPYMTCNLILSAIDSIKNNRKLSKLNYPYPEELYFNLIKFMDNSGNINKTYLKNIIHNYIGYIGIKNHC